MPDLISTVTDMLHNNKSLYDEGYKKGQQDAFDECLALCGIVCEVKRIPDAMELITKLIGERRP
jgi:hypothetical protein